MVTSATFKPIVQILVLLFFANAVILGFIGSQPIEEPFLTIGRFSTLVYFLFFPLLVVCEKIENFLYIYIKKNERLF
jgi:ubiquinol-cytochrome c reductase cytochrome b subunit